MTAHEVINKNESLYIDGNISDLLTMIRCVAILCLNKQQVRREKIIQFI